VTGRRRKSLSAEERALWNSVARTVQPLDARRSKDEAEDAASAPAAPAEKQGPSRRRERLAPPAPKTAKSDSAPAPQPAIDRRVRRRLAKGQMAIDSRLDLHGLDQARAFERLRGHLAAASGRGERCVLVITGKGGRRFDRRGDLPAAKRTKSGESSGVLKRMVPLWLEGSELAALVHAYGAADTRHGGDGALYVLLRRRR